MKHQKLYHLVLAALFAALTYVATNIIHVPIPATDGFINLGDCVVLLGAFLLGPVYGAAAGGIGSALADILSGYAVFAPGHLCHQGAHRGHRGGHPKGPRQQDQGRPHRGQHRGRSMDGAGLFPV